MNYRYLNIDYDKTQFEQESLNRDNLEFALMNPQTGYFICTPKNKNFLRDFISDLPLQPSAVHFFINPPAVPHIDRGRSCAINFPINVDGIFFVAKEYPTQWFEDNVLGVPGVEQIGLRGESLHWPRFQDTKEHYCYNESTNKGYILNTSMPHGAIHEGKEKRYILTLSYSQSYNFVDQAYKEYWD